MIRHGIPSTSLDRAERQLPPLWVFVALDKCLKVRRHFRHLHVVPPADSSATSSETSRAQPSATLKPTTRTGFLYWPSSKSLICQNARSRVGDRGARQAERTGHKDRHQGPVGRALRGGHLP